MENVIYNLGIIDKSVLFVLSTPLYFFLKTPRIQGMSSLDHVMGTIFLIIPVSVLFLFLFYFLPLKRGELGRLFFASGLPLLQFATGWLPRCTCG